MAVRQTMRVAKQMGVENDVMKKAPQSSALSSTVQRRALTEIGNVVRQPNLQASICVEISKEKPAPAQPVRRSIRLSVAQPKKVTRVDGKPRETPVTGEIPVSSRAFGKSQAVAGAFGAPKARTIVRPPELDSAARATRRKSRLGTRAPRLTMKPPQVETPPEEREAARGLIRQSLAAERNRRSTVNVSADVHRALIAQNIRKVVGKPVEKRKEATEIPQNHDVDLMLHGCLWWVSNYSKQIYAYLQRLDRRMASKIVQQPLKMVNDASRAKLVEWMASAYVKCCLLQETFQLSVSILDRYLLSVTEIKETKYELLAVTCLSLAIKYEELLTSLVKELLSLSNRPYTMKEFVEMESEVIRALGFQVARPVPLVFLRRYSTAAQFGRKQHGVGKYLVDLAQLDSHLARLPASTVASAAVFISFSLWAGAIDPDAWSPVMVHYTAKTFNDIRSAVSRMATLALPGGPQCKAIRRKYSTEVELLSADRAQHLLLSLHQLPYA